jgi:glycosyltransferase involved in cell wall biosynthesis
MACRAAHKFGGKVVYDSHELYLECGHTNPVLVRHWRALEEQLIHRADAVITVCDSIGEELQQRYGVPMPVILRNCCEATHTRIGEDLIRATTGIAADTPVVLYQGGFAHGRGLFNLVRATHYIQDAAVVFMGWGAVEGELRGHVRREGLEERIYFIPPAPQSELLSWSAGADVGVIPYQAVRLNNFYSCPNKLFEYINAGIAVAASGFPELTRIIERYQVGRTFDPESPEDMGRTVNRMLHDPEALAQMKCHAEAAARELNWPVESEKLLATYRNLLT